jgi:hypothetical protein
MKHTEIAKLRRLAELHADEMELIEREREIEALRLSLSGLGLTQQQWLAAARLYVAQKAAARIAAAKEASR